MTTPALIMMVIAMTTLWGGLAIAAVNLFRRPDLSEQAQDLPPST